MLSPRKPCRHLPRFLGERHTSRNVDFKAARASQAHGYRHLRPLPGQGTGTAQGKLAAEKGWKSFRDALARWDVSPGSMSQL